MSCGGRALAHLCAGRVILHSCFQQRLWSASPENTGEGGTPALLLSPRVKFGGNVIEKDFLSGAVSAAYSLPLLFFKFFRAQIVRTHQNKKSDDALSYWGCKGFYKEERKMK